MSNQENLTQAQMIDPGLSVEAQINDNVATEVNQRNKLGIGRKFAVLTGATLGVLGLASAEDVITGTESRALADVCIRFDFGTGECLEWVPSPTNPPQPQPTNPPSNPNPGGGGGGGGGGGNGGGSGGGGGGNSGGGGGNNQPTSPPAPTFEQVLAYIGCEDDKGNPELAAQLETLKGGDGSGRIVTIVDWCELDFIEEGGILPEYGRPTTNLEGLIADPSLDVTPNPGQSDALNVYLASEWARLNPPATTTTVAPTTTFPATTEAPTTTSTTTTEVIEECETDTLPEESVADSSSTEVVETTEVEAQVCAEVEDTTPETTEVVETTEAEEVSSPDTTEDAVVVANPESNSGSGSDSSTGWMLPAGLVVGGLTAGLGLVAFARRKRHEEEGQGFGKASPATSA